MAAKYVDQGGGLYPTYAASPTFGTCQDGDGTAIGAATSATCSIDLTGFSAAAGNTLTIGGAILTCVASGAAANQFNAGSGATLAANIASAINAATNTITVTGASNPLLGWRAAQLRDVCYASASGATLQIQTRAGSASYNSTSFFAAVSSGFTGGTINQQFTGGAGGAWGYWISNASMWPSSQAAGAYGAFAATAPIAGLINSGDVVNVRAANRTINMPSNVLTTVAPAAMGSRSSYAVFNIDDGTVWPADGSNPTLTFAVSTNGNNQGITISPNSASYFHLKAKRYASGQRNLIFQATPTGSQSLASLKLAYGPAYRMENVDFVGLASGSNYAKAVLVNGNAAPFSPLYTALSGLRFVWGNTSGSSTYFIDSNGNSTFRVDFFGCEFDAGSGSVTPQNVTNVGSQSGPNVFNFNGHKFSNFPLSSRIRSDVTTLTAQPFTLTFRDCDLGNISDLRPVFTSVGSTVLCGGELGMQGIYLSNSFNGRDFMADTPEGYAAWISTANYPYNNAKLLDGATGWSLRMVPTNSSGSNQTTSQLNPFKSPALSKINGIGSDGVRTITVEYALEKTLAYTGKDISLLVQYQDATTGERRFFDTYDSSGGALTASSTVWQYGDVVDPADSVRRLVYTEGGGTLYHSKYAFSVVTPTAVKAGTEITVWVRLHSPSTGISIGLFVDPEFTIA